MKRIFSNKLLILLILIVIFALGFWIRNTLPAYASPSEAAHQFWLQRNRNAPYKLEDFRVLSQQTEGERVVVLASYQIDSGEGPIPSISYILAKQGPFGWYMLTGQSIGKSPSSGLVLYGTDQRGDASVIYGQVFSPEIASVEVQFTNGEALRQEVTGGGFAVLAPPRWQFEELRLINDQGKIMDPSGAANAQSRAG